MTYGTRSATGIGIIATFLTCLSGHPVTMGHDPDEHEHGHDHPHRVAEPGDDFFTTRQGAKYLPLTDEDDDVFHFVVYGDRTGGVPAGLKVLRQAVSDTNLLDPDLVMTVGDLIQGYNETPEWLQQAKEYRQIMDRLNMKWYPVAGNHDVYWRGETPPPPGHHEANYEKHFGPLWYSFRHKNCGFIVLYSDEGDPQTNRKAFNEGKLQTMSDEQLAFLQQSLDELVGADHVFVFLHHPRWIGGGYTGGNWDKVHGKLKSAGNVSAVFAGHIHHMRYDGPKDGIEYFTLATTGGHLSAEIPAAGYLHHLNMVTVRKKGITVASIPVGGVADPKQFTPEFLKEVDQARSIRAVHHAGEIKLNTDGSATGALTYRLSNSSSRPIQATVTFGSPEARGRDWLTSLDHQHVELRPGQSREFDFVVSRGAGATDSLSMPTIRSQVDFLAESTRVGLPAVDQPLPIKLASVPANYFADHSDRALKVDGDQTVAQVYSDDLDWPDDKFTVEAWIRPQHSRGYRAIVSKSRSDEFALFFDEGVPQFEISTKAGNVVAQGVTTVPEQSWTHVAGVCDGSRIATYVGGRRIASETLEAKRHRGQMPFMVGADPDQAGIPTRSFRGWIDEVRVTADVVYTKDFQPSRRLKPLPQTILLLHFDQRLGPFVLDHSQSAAKAVLGDASTLVEVEGDG